MLNGRQILWLVYQRFRVHKTQAAMLTREHLFSVKLSNDSLREFLNIWDEVMLEMTDEIEEGPLAMRFRKGLDLAAVMREYLKQYDMDRFKSGEDNDYRELYNLAQRIVAERLLSGNSGALDPNAKGKGKGAPGKGEKEKGKANIKIQPRNESITRRLSSMVHLWKMSTRRRLSLFPP
jgi:hypothetical protein